MFLPISYPITIPPIAGEKLNQFFKIDLIFSARELQILEAFLGLLSN